MSNREEGPRPRPRPQPRKQLPPVQPPPPPKAPKHSKKKGSDEKRVPEWITTFLVIIISLVWVASFVAGLLNPHYQVPEQVNLLFSSMVGGLLLNAASKRRGGDSEDE